MRGRPGHRSAARQRPRLPGPARRAAAHPGHVRAAIRDTLIHTAADNLINTLLSHDRAAMLAATLPRTQADHDHQAKARAAELRRQLAQNAAAQNGLITQLEQLGGDTSPAANAMRERNTDQFTDRYNQARTLQAELDAITTAQPAADNPALLDELPYATDLLAQAPGVINALLNDLHADSDTFGNSTHAAAVG